MKPTYVVSDLHGQADKFEGVVGQLGVNAHWVINGDALDRGEKAKELLDIFLQIDNLELLPGNHEWAYLGGLTSIDPTARAVWQEALFSPSLRNRIEKNVLRSYDISRHYDPEGTAKALKEKMQELGHLSLLQSSQIYYEDDELFVIHAGLKSEMTMPQIYHRLDALQAKHDAHLYDDEPDELFSFRLANDYSVPRGLGKLLITGHVHSNKTAEERLYCPPNYRQATRAFLGSYLDMDNPLFVYDSQEKIVRSF